MPDHSSDSVAERHWLTRLRPLELAEFLKWALRIRRRVIEVDGLRVWIDPASNVGSRLLAEGTYERILTGALPQILGPGGVFYDIGANEGWFSITAARLVGLTGRVVAVEPQERLWPVILQNASLNHMANVCLQPFAIGLHEGEAQIHLYPSVNTGASALGGSKRRFEQNQRVSLVPLARLIEGAGVSRIDLMKVDIEGFELEALRSAGDHLGSTIRCVVVETHAAQLASRGESPEQLFALLMSRGYHHRRLAGVDVWELGVQAGAPCFAELDGQPD